MGLSWGPDSIDSTNVCQDQTRGGSKAAKIPVLGFGTLHLEGSSLKKALKSAIVDGGYRLIDCASIYNNEKAIGEALEDILSNPSLCSVKRSDLCISSKLWSDSHQKERVLDACKKTLSDLRLEYLDLYLINYPIPFLPHVLEPTSPYHIDPTVNLIDTWLAMESLVEKGLVKAIGVSNFEIEHLETLLRSDRIKIKPVINQIETHPYLLRSDLIDYCQSRDIMVYAYSPLGAPNNAWNNQPRMGLPKLLEDFTVMRIAEHYNKTPAQILLRWALQRGVSRGHLMGAVVKSDNPAHIVSNAQIFDFLLAREDMELLSSMNRGTRFNYPTAPWLGRSSFR